MYSLKGAITYFKKQKLIKYKAMQKMFKSRDNQV